MSTKPQPRPGKSATAFRTISEVADELDVAQHVLRFWESKFPQVHPLKRGGGRRYYRPEDVEVLRQLRSLLYDEGYTIKGAQKLLRGQRRRAGEEGDEAEDEAAAELPQEAVGVVEAPMRRRLERLRANLVALRDLLARGAGGR
jgi:DNA-binding transcriptional MerR regulator